MLSPMPLINTYVLSMPGYFLHIILVRAHGSHGRDWDQMLMPTLLDSVADPVVLADIGSMVWWADADVLASRVMERSYLFLLSNLNLILSYI